ncbi:MAG: sodium/solute symporter [Pirellulaceae bacterium]|nr:sodium/solute symporter [Pirellulaceae bacterium]
MPTTIQLHPVDIAIVGIYLAILLLIGLYHSGKQDSLMEFFMAHKGMSWIPVGITLMAALNSGIDYLNTPSAVIRLGWLNILFSCSWLIIFPYMFYVMIPMFRRLDVMSAYEYLGRRFGEGMRTFSSCLFMGWRLSWMASALYVPSLALSTAVGHPEWLVPMIVVLGTLVTIYTMLGGMKAVIWSDFTQFVLMMTGLVVTLFVVLWNVEGGVATVAREFFQPGIDNAPKANADTSSWLGQLWSYMSIDMVLPGIILAWFVRLGGFTSDQVMIQRFSTAKSLKHARQSFLITALSDISWMVLLYIVGVALVVYIKSGSDLPDWVLQNADQIFPYVMAKVFPVGVTGLVLAAILAASLSSVDSAINSLTTVGMVDFYHRLYLGRSGREEFGSPAEQKRQVWISRCLNVAIGVVGILLACYVQHLGELFNVMSKVLSTFMAVMLGIFWLGMFTQRATTRSTMIGAVAGASVAWFLGFYEPLALGALWVAPAGLLVTLFLGFVLGTNKPSEAARRWNWFAIVRTELVE